jgi:PIN domain nuclease of toxin-antitoxin system
MRRIQDLKACQSMGLARSVSRIPRTAVADPFDRMIAATAPARAAPLVTYDRRLRQVTVLETVCRGSDLH